MLDFTMRLKKHELAKITGLHPRRLLEWQRLEYLVPIEPRHGKGKISYFDEFNCLEALILKKLSENGISLSKFNNIFKGVRKNPLTRSIFNQNIKKKNFRLVIYGQCDQVSFIMTDKNISAKEFGETNEAKLIKDNAHDVIVTISLNAFIERIKEFSTV